MLVENPRALSHSRECLCQIFIVNDEFSNKHQNTNNQGLVSLHWSQPRHPFPSLSYHSWILANLTEILKGSFSFSFFIFHIFFHILVLSIKHSQLVINSFFFLHILCQFYLNPIILLRIWEVFKLGLGLSHDLGVSMLQLNLISINWLINHKINNPNWRLKPPIDIKKKIKKKALD